MKRVEQWSNHFTWLNNILAGNLNFENFFFLVLNFHFCGKMDTLWLNQFAILLWKNFILKVSGGIFEKWL